MSVAATGPSQDSDAPHSDSGASFALRYVIPGVVASVLIVLGSLGVGWLPLDSVLNGWPLVEALRGTTLGSIVSKGAVLVGVVLLLQSWLVLGFGVMHSTVRSMKRLWITLLAWAAPLMLCLPLFSRDVYSYFAQGKLLVQDIDPYTKGVVELPGWFGTGADPLWGESPAPYGPLFLLLERGVAAFSNGDPLLGAYVFRIIAVLGVLLLAWSVPKLSFMHGISPPKAFWLVVLNPLVFMHFIIGVHNDALMIGLIAAGFVLALERHPALGVMAVSLGAAVKPIGLLALPFLGIIWAGRTATFGNRVSKWILTLLIAIVTFVILSLISRTGIGWLGALATPGKVRTWLSPPTAIGMITGQLVKWIGIGTIDFMVNVFRILGQLAALGLIAWLALKPYGRSATRAAGVAFIAIVFLGPVVQPWYVLWGLPLVVAAGLTRNELRVVLIGSAAFTVYGVATSSSTQDTLFELSDGIALLAVAVVIAILLLTSPRERRLLLGAPEDEGLRPETPAARARAAEQVVVGPGPSTSPDPV